MLLLGPAAERVRGRCDWRNTMSRGYLDDATAKTSEIFPGLLYVLTNLGANFDLRSKQLARYLVSQNFLTLFKQGLRWINNQTTRLLVDEKIFFFYSNGEFRFVSGHYRCSCFMSVS